MLIDLTDITTIYRAGWLDSFQLRSEPSNDICHRRDLSLAGRRTRMSRYRDSIRDDESVLDEGAIGMALIRSHRCYLQTARFERATVRRML